jgi:hypothetical protein
MSDATIIGIIGLASSVVIALGQTILANRRHGRQLEHDRALADRAELREALDSAAQTLRRAMWGIEGVRAAFAAGDYESIIEAGREGQRLAEHTALDNGRIALRLGRDHELYQHHDEAMNVFIELAQELLRTLPKGLEKHLTFRREPTANRLQARIEDAEIRFSFARGAFIDAAEKLVGADVRTARKV